MNNPILNILKKGDENVLKAVYAYYLVGAELARESQDEQKEERFLRDASKTRERIINKGYEDPARSLS